MYRWKKARFQKAFDDYNSGFVPVESGKHEKAANPELQGVVDKLLHDIDKKRTASKEKSSVKTKLKENTGKAAPKKSKTTKAKEERA